MTPEQEERLRGLYRRNFLGAILLPPEAIAQELDDNEKDATQIEGKPSGTN